MHVAILGDSPVIVQNRNQNPWVSPEHNVITNEKEREAAVKRGAIYKFPYIHDAEDYARASGVCWGVQMSRAFGDYSLYRVLNRKPEILSVPIAPGTIVIVATDGVLDPSHSDASAHINRLLRKVACGSGAKALVNDALKRETGDNATAIVCILE